ncbi:hypothetical protein JYT15_00340, partial [Acidimicrobium ferrooxidans]|nr:hypothetical protein [Acidimicrobium ferrooxidans]
AVVLFLDELILWLANHAASLGFIQREGQKLAKLVEAQEADRPIPLLSFVARQRDLRDLVGDDFTGAERLNFSEILGHWEGRFHTITLEDRNLPEIAEKRVLRPKNEAARAQLDRAFAETAKIRESVMRTLLTSKYDRSIFRRVYPFSPALVDTLVGVSSLLQRERTALKVMLLLLVEKRDSLALGDIVPVGDLFDVIAHGDEAFNPDMRVIFENAKRLYHLKLLPLLERLHGCKRNELEDRPAEDPVRRAFETDDRLIKTLLLAALVPGVESLQGMTAGRLAALNHGTIRLPVEGREGQEVLRRCRQWAGEVSEIKIGAEAADPSITVQLTGVDTDSILDQASGEDKQGNRIRRVKKMIFECLGVEDNDERIVEHRFAWRHTPRSCEVLFGNVRELPPASLEARGETWRLLVDFPFDEGGHGPSDDLSRLETFRNEHEAGARTIAWLPSFFSAAARRDLGRLVVIEHVLAGERFEQYAAHLSPQDKPVAKALLENQRSQLQQRVLGHLETAYGLTGLAGESVDPSHQLDQHFVSLFPGFEPAPPVASDLADALGGILDQALAYQFPGHPEFEEEVKSLSLRKVHEVISEASRTEDGRLAVDKNLRPLIRAIAGPLELGEMAETHFVLGQRWLRHFDRRVSEAGESVSVADLRNWIDDPRPMGLPVQAQNLVILGYAEQADYCFLLHGGPHDATLAKLPDAAVLEKAALPESEEWIKACDRAGHILGASGSPLLNASNVVSLSKKVREAASGRLADCRILCQRLRERLVQWDLDPARALRMRTASAMLALLERIELVEADQVVHTLAEAQVETTAAAMGACFANAAALSSMLADGRWEVVDTIASDAREVARVVRQRLSSALDADEHVSPLGVALERAQSEALGLLAVTPPPPPPLPPTGGQNGRIADLAPAQARKRIDMLEGELGAGQELQITLEWRIEEEDGDS